MRNLEETMRNHRQVGIHHNVLSVFLVIVHKICKSVAYLPSVSRNNKVSRLFQGSSLESVCSVSSVPYVPDDECTKTLNNRPRQEQIFAAR